MWLGADLKMDTKKHMLNDYLCAQDMLIPCRFTSSHDCMDLCEHLMSTRVFTLIMKKILKWAPKTVRQMATCMVWACWSSHTICKFHILQEASAERKSIHLLYTPEMTAHTWLIKGHHLFPQTTQKQCRHRNVRYQRHMWLESCVYNMQWEG